MKGTFSMKAFNFDEPTERRGTGSYKWDSADADVIPLWVADMDFRTAPCIIEALGDRVRHGVFGYEKVPDAWYEALQGWFARRHGWEIRREAVLCTTGVVPAVSAVIKAFTRPGDGVALLTPAYNCFFSSIRNNGCFAAETALIEGDAGWMIDFAALEKTLADPRVKVLLFCRAASGRPTKSAGRLKSHTRPACSSSATKFTASLSLGAAAISLRLQLRGLTPCAR